MIAHGDEMGRTQQGNNNTYCQDNELSWVNWDLNREQQDLLAFTTKLITLRQDHPVLRRRRFFAGDSDHGGVSPTGDIEWLRPSGERMSDDDWNTWFSKAVMVYLNGSAIPEPDHRGETIIDDDLLIAINASDEQIDFTLPGEGYGIRWHESIYTYTPADPDMTHEAGESITIEPRSLMVLIRPVTDPLTKEESEAREKAEDSDPTVALSREVEEEAAKRAPSAPSANAPAADQKPIAQEKTD